MTGEREVFLRAKKLNCLASVDRDLGKDVEMAERIFRHGANRDSISAPGKKSSEIFFSFYKKPNKNSGFL